MSTCRVHPLPYRADPAAYFALVRHAPGAVLLDAGRPQAERGRFDLLSAWPLDSYAADTGETAEQFFQRLRDGLKALGRAEAPPTNPLPFTGGLIGYLAYDFGRRLEQLPAQASDDLALPDARFGLYGWALISDHLQQTSQLVFHPRLEQAERARLVQLFETGSAQDAVPFSLRQPFRADLDQDDYRRAIERIQAYIQAGDCYQVNFAQRFQAPCQGDAWSAYQALRAACPTPFAGFQALDNGAAILSLSPERFLQVSQGRVETRPIKGTRPRGATPAEDATNAAELLASPKDRAENLMIVDLLRNDLGRSCSTGSVRAPELFALTR
jgi:para-aminobenzoate synthetase component 1